MFESFIQLAAGWVLPGLFFLAVLSLLAMAIQDVINEMLGNRSRFLEKGITQMLDDEELAGEFFTHPLLITNSSKQQSKIPGRAGVVPPAISPRIFAQFLLDKVLHDKTEKGNLTIEKLRRKMDLFTVRYPKIGNVVRLMFTAGGIDNSTNKVETILQNTQQGLQVWYDDSMQEITRWFRRATQKSLFVTGLILAVYVNFDVITLTGELWATDKVDQISKSIMEKIEKAADNDPSSVEGMIAALQIVDLTDRARRMPIGWYVDDIASEMSCSILSRVSFTIVTSPNQCYVVNGIPPLQNFFGWMIKFIGWITGGVAIALCAQFSYEAIHKPAGSI